MDPSSIRGLIVILALLTFKIFVTMGYSSLINVSKSGLRERSDSGDRAARRALKLGEDAKNLLTLHQYLSILLTVLIAGATVVTLFPSLDKFLSDLGLSESLSDLVSFIIIMPILSSLLLIFGERVPIGMVLGRTESVAILAARPMQTLVKALGPFISLNLRLSRKIAQWLGGSDIAHFVTEEEIKTIVDAGSEEGVLDNEEKEMIYSIIRFGDTIAREVMLPRIDMVALEDDATLDEALSLIIAKGHSRIPIYRDSIDNIEGVLYAKDLLEVWQSGEKPEKLTGLLREAHFVPESKKASDLLIEMQNRKIHMVFVVDEYGGTAGLVTLEDLVEEIIGEIQDEYDINEEKLMHKIDENTYIFSARLDLDDLNHLLDVAIPTDEIDTLGGLIFSELGRVPITGDEITAYDLKIIVQSVTGRRIRKVRVEKILRDEDGEYSSPEAESAIDSVRHISTTESET